MQQTLKPETAQTIALQALSHIAADEDLLGGFMAHTGLAIEELKPLAADPAFLGGVLDFLLSDETGLLAFCEATDTAPDLPKLARQSLPGGEEVHWT
jgi:Protein of unknown function (DUF3572)